MTWSFRQYGPAPWQWLHWYDDGTTTAKPLIIFIPGGGWGLRDPLPIIDPDSRGAESFTSGALLNPDSPYFESYRVAVMNVASNGFNGYNPLDLDRWTNGTTYAINAIVDDGAKFQCRGQHVANPNLKPSRGSKAGTVWTQVTRTGSRPNWQNANGYTVGEIVRDGLTHDWQCNTAHTSSTDTKPAAGSQAVRFWRQIQQNDISRPRIANRGDGSPAFGVRGPTDGMRAIAWARQNAWRFNVIPDRIGIAGSSAGGHAVGLTVALSSNPITGVSRMGMSHRAQAVELSQPNAAMMKITPQKLHLYAPNGGGGGFRAFMASLFGDDSLRGIAGWRDLPEAIKRSLDVYHALESGGEICPVLFEHTEMVQLATGNPGNPFTLAFSTDHHASLTDAQLFAQQLVHHPRNGWLGLELMQRVASQGGRDQDGCAMIEHDTVPGWIRTYTRHPGLNNETGIEGTHYTRQQVYAAGEVSANSNGGYDAPDNRMMRVVGEKTIDWFNEAFDL